MKEYSDAKRVANWIINEFLRMIKADETLISGSLLKQKAVAEVFKLVDDRTISGSVAKTVLQKVFETGDDPRKIVEKEGLGQISDESALEAIVDEIVAANPTIVEKYRGGNEKMIGFFVGQVMKKTEGRANPALVNQLLKRKLASC